MGNNQEQNREGRIDVSVIVVNWNTSGYLRRCLTALLASEGDYALEIIVVDNASSDDSLEMLRNEFPFVRVIANQTNSGFASANNQGLALATGRLLLLLNPDTEIAPGALSEMVRFLEQNPRAGAVGPRLTGQRGRIQGGAAGYEPSLRTVFNHASFLYRACPRWFPGVWLAVRQYRRAAPFRVDWVSGAALMVRRVVVDEVGILDDKFFMYAEDVDWCRRMREAGWEVYCLPNTHVMHFIGASAKQPGAGFITNNVDSRDRYYRSRYRPAVVTTMHLINAIGFLARVVIHGLMYLIGRTPVHRQLTDLWWSCMVTSVQRMAGPMAHAGHAVTGEPAAEMQMTTAQRVARNTASLAVVQGFRILASLAITLYIARFGAAWLGKYALLLAYLNIFQVLSDFGLPRLLTREVARDRNAGRTYFWNALAAQMLTAVASMLLMVAAVNVIGYPVDTTQMLLVATLAIPPYAVASVAGAMLQASERMGTLAISEGLNTAWQLVGSVWLLATGRGVIALAWVRVVGVAITAVVNLIGMRRVTHPGIPKASLRIAFSLLRGSVDLFVLAGFGAILFRLDVLILNEIAGEAATGIYNAAYQLAKVVTLLSMAYADAIFPALSRFYWEQLSGVAGGEERARWVLRKSFGWGAAVMLPIAVFCTLLAGPIIRLLYQGAEYGAAIPVLPWLGWMLFPYFAYVILTRALVAANLQNIARDTTVAMVAAGAVLIYVLARWQGMVGTAIAAAVVFAFGAVRNSVYVQRKLGSLHVGQAVWRALPSTALLFVVLLFVRQWPLWLSAPFGFVVYIIAALLTKVFTRDDLMMVRSMLSRRPGREAAVAQSEAQI